MIKRFLAGVVLGGVLLAASSLQAHHSLAGTYDLKKTERATGVVQRVAFTNPHGALTIDIKNAEGVTKTWILTTGSINVLTNAGISATPARIGSRRAMSSRSLSIPRSTAATWGFSGRWCCRTRQRPSLSRTDD